MTFGIDTNILVRYLTQDDATQFTAALRLLTKKDAVFFVSDLALAELDWVLSGVYNWSKDEIAETIARLLTVHNLIFENEDRIRAALRAVRQGADLADVIIAAHCREHGCARFATFDRRLRRHLAQFSFEPQ